MQYGIKIKLALVLFPLVPGTPFHEPVPVRLSAELEWTDGEAAFAYTKYTRRLLVRGYVHAAVHPFWARELYREKLWIR